MNDNRKIVLFCNNSDNIKGLCAAYEFVKQYDVSIAIQDRDTSIPDELAQLPKIEFDDQIDTEAKSRNFILKSIKNSGFNGFVHIITQSVEFIKSPDSFMNEIETMMDVMDYHTWLNTVTDPCNFVISKYNPRLKLTIDDPKYADLGIKSLILTSHSNLSYSIFNLAKADESLLSLDENFTIPMFFIIEYLARRRNSNPNSLFFMNQYMTVESEYSTFKLYEGVPEKPTDQKVLADEDKIFKSMAVNYSPDNNIDMILERIYLKLLKTRV